RACAQQRIDCGATSDRTSRRGELGELGPVIHTRSTSASQVAAGAGRLLGSRITHSAERGSIRPGNQRMSSAATDTLAEP
ncbi:MAG: hypothetical protein ACRDNK_14745, partial [Solirubrobacteraceae bacterium]